MARKNVTVAIEAEILKEARHMAVEKGMSLSALLAETLEVLVRDDASYRRARNRQAALLKNPPDLGTKGKPTWTREDLQAGGKISGVRILNPFLDDRALTGPGT